LKNALQILDATEQTDVVVSGKINALIAVAEGLKDGGHRDAAWSLLKNVRRLVELIQDQSSKSGILRTIAMAQARLGDVQGALQSERAITEEMYKNLSLMDIAEAQIEQADLKGALQTADALGQFDPLRKESVLTSIARAYANAGQVEEAKAISKQVDHPFRASAFRAIGKAMTKAGDTDQALNWASHHEHRLEKAYILIGIAEELLEQKERNRAS
jgi:hypothetical protein